jgi:hypothetical protein
LGDLLSGWRFTLTFAPVEQLEQAGQEVIRLLSQPVKLLDGDGFDRTVVLSSSASGASLSICLPPLDLDGVAQLLESPPSRSILPQNMRVVDGSCIGVETHDVSVQFC